MGEGEFYEAEITGRELIGSGGNAAVGQQQRG
jgi:hypothetical protein